MAFCEGSVLDADGELVAHATGTFKYLKGLPAGGKRDPAAQRIRLKGASTMATINRQIHLVSRPKGEAERRQLPPASRRRCRDAAATARCWCATTT